MLLLPYSKAASVAKSAKTLKRSLVTASQMRFAAFRGSFEDVTLSSGQL